MKRHKFYYLIEIQYLGFRLHGWQFQPGVKTVQGMINKTLAHVIPDHNPKSLGGMRTDAKVSANQSYFELFVDELLPENFLEEFNINLPQDIKAISVKQVDKSFNIIQQPKIKEYNYIFAEGCKAHPFAAALVSCFQEKLDIDLMKEAARVFQGKHSFHSFVVGASEKTILERELLLSDIIDNTIYTANFFPEKTYIFRVKGEGFLRYQVRLMMGALVRVGNGQLNIEDLKDSLINKEKKLVHFSAPASGLILQSVEHIN